MSETDPGRLEVRGTTVVVSGGSGGIGRAIARRFAALGKQVVVLDRDLAGARELQRDHPTLRAVRVDLADGADTARAFEALRAEGLAADVLVNCVGVSPKFDASGERLTFWTAGDDDWRALFDVNVMSYVACQRACVPGMLERGYGRIVNIGSYAARTGGFQGAAHYQTAKSAILGMTRALAREVAARGITVNTVNPGRIATAMTRDVSDEANAAAARQIPMGRLGTPDDVASAVLFFASTLADYITGAVLEVNGGVYMSQ